MNFIIKIVLHQFEQIFRIKQADVTSMEDVEKMLTKDFLDKNGFKTEKDFKVLGLLRNRFVLIENGSEQLAADDPITFIAPEEYRLEQNYPNPFNPTTSFELNVGNAGHVTMNVYNVMGQVVETLVNNTMDAGSYNITWDATNFSSGMYVVKAETANGLASQKVMLVK